MMRGVESTPSAPPDARPRRRPAAARRTPFGSWVLGSEAQSPRRLRVRVQTLLTLALTLTHGIGAGVVLMLSLFVVTAPAPAGATGWPWRSRCRSTSASRWWSAPCGAPASRCGACAGPWTAREPTALERRRVLRVPLRLTVLAGVLWLVADVLFVGLALWLQPERALSTGLTVAIGGVVACAVAYLLSEFALRPVAARALGGEGHRRRGRRPPPRPGRGRADADVLAAGHRGAGRRACRWRRCWCWSATP